MLALLTPPGHVPDEYNHACRADSLRYGALIGHREMQDGRLVSGLPCNPGLRSIIRLASRPTDPTPEPYTHQMRELAAHTPWAPAPVFAEGGSIAGYMPVFYVPGALAIGATEALGGGPAAAFRAMRLVNLACFTILGMLALCVARRGQTLIACTLMLPMTLSLAGSCSQDGLLIACAALACACLTRAGGTDTSHPAPWFVSAALCLALVSLAKPPYAPLALLLFLPAPRNILRTVGVCALVVLPSIAWVAFEIHYAAVAPLRPPLAAGPLWPGPPTVFAGPDFAAQVQVLAAHPWSTVALPWTSLTGSAGELLIQAVGVLDSLSIFLPHALYAIWFVALAASILSDMSATDANRPGYALARLIPLVAIWLSATAVALALYLQWTPVGMPWIGGVEGRYLLPLLPVLALALPAVAMPRLGVALRMIPFAAATTNLLWLPRVVQAFYAS